MLTSGETITVLFGKKKINCEVLKVITEQGVFVAKGDSDELPVGKLMMMHGSKIDEVEIVKKQNTNYIIAYSAIKTNDERRKDIRYPFNQKIKIRIVKGEDAAGDWFVGMGKDLSGGGMSLYTPKLITPKSKLEVMIALGEKLKIPGIVRWLYRGRSAYQLGVAFDEDKAMREKIIKGLSSGRY